MSSTLDVHMVMTGHSLGRNKLEHLLASGRGCCGPGVQGGTSRQQGGAALGWAACTGSTPQQT